MNLLKILLVIGLAAAAWHYLNKPDQPRTITASAGAAMSANGFLALPPAQGQSPAGILVFAAKDCPEEDARRADELAADLKARGVPVQRINDISFSSSDPNDFGRINTVMSGQLPIVFVNGSGKANPSLSDVLAEYKGS